MHIQYNNDSNAAFMEMATKKLEAQSKRIDDLEVTIKETSQDNTLSQEIKNTLSSIQSEIARINFPHNQMKDLTRSLYLLRTPVKNEIAHHHHVTKGFWIIAGLLIIISALSGFLFSAISKLDQFRAADIKYRFAKLQSYPDMEIYLFRVDSLYQSNYAMKDSVERWENEMQEYIVLHHQLEENDAHGEILRREAERLSKANAGRKNANK